MIKDNKIVIKVGGSLLFKEDASIDPKKVEEFCNILKQLKDFEKIIIICGGGKIARKYIDAARSLGGNESLCDLFGIEISRINSKLFITALNEEAYPQVPKSMEDLSVALISKKFIVIGGLQPGQSTTSVALEVSEFINAEKVIILTDVDGIYDKDPNKYKDTAKFYEKITSGDLEKLLLNYGDKQAAAGGYQIFDMVSLQLLKRSGIPIHIINGNDLDRLKQFLNGKTTIKHTLVTK